MGDFSLIIKDIKSLFLKQNFVFLWNFGALGTTYKKKKKKASFTTKQTNPLLLVSRIYRPSAIVSRVTSFNYYIVIILYTFKEVETDVQRFGVTGSRSSSC